MFINSANEIGSFESGLAARLMGVVPSVLFGGAMSVLVVDWSLDQSAELKKIQLLIA